MHPYELQIIDFMKAVGNSVLDVTKLPLKPAPADVEHYLRKIYEADPARPFRISMSNIGKPLCQLQMEQAKAEAVEDDYNLPLRFMFGAIIEGLTVSVLKHSGIKVNEEQTKVELPIDVRIEPKVINTYTIPGTLDLVLEGRVWDIKSASEYAFKEKFNSYEALKEDDTFGYLPQLYGYSAARKLPPGGFIVINKSSGQIKVLPVMADYAEEQARCLSIITENVKILHTKGAFKRCFEDEDEKFQKRLTGNKRLGSTCGFCKFKYSCWPGLQHLPNLNSTAFEKPYVYYTKVSQ